MDALFRKKLSKNFPYLRLVRHIACVRRRLPARIGYSFRGRFRLLQIDINDSHCGAIRREAQSNCLPDATPAAGHNGGFSVQSEILHAAAGALQSEIPLFHGIKSSWPFPSAFVGASPLAVRMTNSRTSSPICWMVLP